MEGPPGLEECRSVPRWGNRLIGAVRPVGNTSTSNKTGIKNSIVFILLLMFDAFAPLPLIVTMGSTVRRFSHRTAAHAPVT